MKTLSLLVIGTLLTACGSSAGTSGAVTAEADPHAAMPKRSMAADPVNPYAASEAEMHERMMTAKAADPSESWTRKMIEHHRGAITMSEALLALPNADPQVAAMARRTIETQGAEIDEMNAMLRASGKAPQPAPST